MRLVRHCWGTVAIGYPRIPTSQVRRFGVLGEKGDNQREDPPCLGADEKGAETTRTKFEIWCVHREPRVFFFSDSDNDVSPNRNTKHLLVTKGGVRKVWRRLPCDKT